MYESVCVHVCVYVCFYKHMHMQRYMFGGVCLCVESMYCVSVCERKRERKEGMCVCTRALVFILV